MCGVGLGRLVLRWDGIWIMVEAEQRAEGEMLHDGEFGEDFCVVHFKHALNSVSVYVYKICRIKNQPC